MKHLHFGRAVVSATILLLASSCGLQDIIARKKPKIEPVQTATPATPEAQVKEDNAPDSDLDKLRGEWLLFSIQGKTVEGDDRPYIFINGDKFYGNNGCNYVNGAIELKGKSLRFSNVLTTLRYCDDAPFDMLFNNTINTIRSYSITREGNDSYLNLADEHGHTVMVLRNNNMEFLNGAWKVTRISGKNYKGENNSLEIVIDIPEKHVSGRTVCNTFYGEIFIDPAKTNSLQFVNIITTLAACPDMSTENDFLIALELTDTAYPTNDKVVVLCDSHGNELLHLERLNLPQ